MGRPEAEARACFIEAISALLVMDCSLSEL